jgi:hypothetical protein
VAHQRVAVDALLEREILPHFRSDYLLDTTTNSQSPFWRKQAGRLNGTQAWAERSIAIIQDLTCRADISHTTMYLWRVAQGWTDDL